MEHRLFRLEQKRFNRGKHIPSVVFGGKKLFKSQFTKKDSYSSHEEWKSLYIQKRNKRILISGRKDAGSGNFVFSYNLEKKELSMRSTRGNIVTFPNVVFPYGQERVDKAILNQTSCKNKKEFGKPISWSIEGYGGYFIIKCLVDVENKEYINFSTSDGVIGVDLNVDHFAIANVKKDGNLLGTEKASFSLKGKSSGQSVKIIEQEAIALVDYAVQNNKPIVIEDIDTSLSKTGDAYGNKNAIRSKSVFAYRKMSNAILNRAEKMGVEVIIVHPAFTSISGKMKYMRKLGISIHQSAAFTIGRRGLGYKEKAPKVLKDYVGKKDAHHWKKWSTLNKRIKISTNAFYELYNVNKPFKGINTKLPSLRENERKLLSKLA
ncbi:IS200/IS605 family accessory protein TnpB-related protein [Neobacillus notoginsengisoli]|uniref:IS200/IS605 family accessory protein TnpB-related protein n=1 Tax=Neobacillus notoginsengisoli TaxID=1578198 RepID=UPI0030843A28